MAGATSPYVDCFGKRIREGFYKHEDYGLLFHFTGKYDIEDKPIFEMEEDNKRIPLHSNLVQLLCRLDEDRIKEEIEKSTQQKGIWIKERLKE